MADEAGPVHEQEPADDAGGHPEHDDGVADTEGVGEEAGDDPAGEATDEEDVHGGEGRAHAPQPVGDDGVEDRAHHGEGRGGEYGLGDAEDHEPGVAVDRELQGGEDGRRQDEQAHQGQGPGRVLAVDAVEVLADEGQQGQGPDPAQGQDDAPVEHVGHVQVVVEVQRGQGGLAEQAEAQGAEGHEHGADGGDLLQPGEGRLHRDGGRVLLLHHLVQDVVLLELAPGWFLHEEGADGHQRHRDPEQVPGPAPPLLPTGDVGDGGHEDRAHQAQGVGGPLHGGRHPGPDPDRVGVGDRASPAREWCWPW